MSEINGDANGKKKNILDFNFFSSKESSLGYFLYVTRLAS